MYTWPPMKSARGIMTMPRPCRMANIIVLSDALVTSPMYPYLTLIQLNISSSFTVDYMAMLSSEYPPNRM